MTLTKSLCAKTDFEVRPAMLHERRAVRMLLSGALDRWNRPALIVAVAGEPSGVVGAAAMGLGPARPLLGQRFAIRVTRPFRRRGIGSALVRRSAEQARRKDMKALYAWESIEPGSDEADLWTCMGFTSSVRQHHYEADPRNLVKLLEPHCARMRHHGWIPAEARIVPLDQAPIQPIVDLWVRHLGGAAVIHKARLEGRTNDSINPSLSCVLMLGDRVEGFVLARLIEPMVSNVEVMVVLPELRLGWATALLKLHAAQQAASGGRRLFRFVAVEDLHEDTRKMAVLAGGRLSKTMLIPYRPLELEEPLKTARNKPIEQ